VHEVNTVSSDDELRRRLIDGDETALGRVYDVYGPYIYRMAVKFTGNRTAAEDILQEVVCELWLRPEVFDPARGTLRRWVSTLAHRRSVDWVRREEAALRRLCRALQDPSEPYRRPATDTEETALSAVIAVHVRSAVASLPAAQRRAVHLAYYEGQSYRQVADTLGIPEGTAKSRLRLGLHRLSALLAAEGITSCP
jgi:RNA polymerase sigma-70 factor (ECF subfamily)